MVILTVVKEGHEGDDNAKDKNKQSLDAPSQRKRRASSKRSAHGCLKCKERHVKCDERRPSCLRCEHADLICPGYAPPKARRSRIGDFKIVTFGHGAPSAPLTKPDSNSTDLTGKLAFEYFTLRTLPLLRQSGHHDLWDKTALQIVHSAPVLRHVAVAIGLRHMQLSGEYRGAKDRLLENVRLYTRAISSFRESLASTERNTTTTSLACLLFILFESLQKRPAEILLHLRTGLRVIEEDTIKRPRSNVECSIISILRTLNMNSIFYSPRIPISELPSATGSVPSVLESVNIPSADGDASQEELWSNVNGMSRAAFRFVMSIAFAAFPDRATELQAMSQLDAQFQRVTEALESRIATESEVQNKFVYRVLLARCIVGITFAKGLRSTLQTAYDAFFENFRRIVDLLRTCLQENNTRGERPLFSLGPGTISTLAATISQCRHPKIRRDALELLKICPRREGVWDAEEAWQIGQKLIEFEEQRMVPSEDGTMMLPAEEYRVHLIEHIEPSEENNWRKYVAFKCNGNLDAEDPKTKFFRIDLEDNC